MKLLNPSDPTAYQLAENIKRPKMLMNKLVQTARIDGRQVEVHTLETTFH